MLKDHNAVTPVRLESAAPRSRVKHSTIEPLCSHRKDQMSHRTVCRWVAKLSAGQQQLKDAARTGLTAKTTTKGYIEKNPKYPQNSCSIHRMPIGLNDKLVVIKSSWNFEETPKS